MYQAPVPTRDPKYIAPTDGLSYKVIDDIVTCKATATETNGAYSLFERRTAPGGSFPRHRKRYEDETIWVLDGTYTVVLGDQTIIAQIGSYIFVPRGSSFTIMNSGTGVGHMLSLITPGGIHERFIAELGEPVAMNTIPPTPNNQHDVERINTIAEKYGIELLLPYTLSAPT